MEVLYRKYSKTISESTIGNIIKRHNLFYQGNGRIYHDSKSKWAQKGKFALTLNYKRLTSRNMKEFYHRFKEVYPVSAKSWQSDNGREFLGEFDEELKRDGIPHYFSYPRCPKINTYIERYNRTISKS